MLNIYINTWGNYNENGAWLGEWITLPMDEDELQEKLDQVAEAMHDEDPEWFVNDYEWTTERALFEVNELDNYFELNTELEKLNELNSCEQELLMAAVEVFGYNNIDLDELDNYTLLSDVHNDYDLGYYWIEESGCYNLDLMGNLGYYIDYERFGRDVRLESDGGFSSLGWIERG